MWMLRYGYRWHIGRARVALRMTNARFTGLGALLSREMIVGKRYWRLLMLKVEGFQKMRLQPQAGIAVQRSRETQSLNANWPSLTSTARACNGTPMRQSIGTGPRQSKVMSSHRLGWAFPITAAMASYRIMPRRPNGTSALLHTVIRMRKGGWRICMHGGLVSARTR